MASQIEYFHEQIESLSYDERRVAANYLLGAISIHISEETWRELVSSVLRWIEDDRKRRSAVEE